MKNGAKQKIFAEGSPLLPPILSQEKISVAICTCETPQNQYMMVISNVWSFITQNFIKNKKQLRSRNLKEQKREHLHIRPKMLHLVFSTFSHFSLYFSANNKIMQNFWIGVPVLLDYNLRLYDINSRIIHTVILLVHSTQPS